MRYYIIFGVTFLLCLLILINDPYDKYLGIYDDEMFIEYLENEEGYHWIYESNNILNIEEINEKKWKLTSNKNGVAKISFYYVDDEDVNNVKYSIDYEFEIKFNKIYWTSGECVGLDDFPNPY